MNREPLPALLAREWDILIIGGGITGAGILLEASRRGLAGAQAKPPPKQ